MNEQLDQLTTDIARAITSTKAMIGQNPFADITLGVIADHLIRADTALCQLANAAKRAEEMKTASSNNGAASFR